MIEVIVWVPESIDSDYGDINKLMEEAVVFQDVAAALEKFRNEGGGIFKLGKDHTL